VPQAEVRRFDGETTIRRITWLSSVSTAADLMSNLIQPGSDPQTVKSAGPTLFAIADAIYQRARQVEQGVLEVAPTQREEAPSFETEDGMYADTDGPEAAPFQ
jgi:hypothetical protein